ncbi:MAG TPA: glycosyl hydrolase family 28-related protein [Gaiellaceae bacterium]|nr:glycosyl hydrolase family 28-related protein [Gaiellaceae bacterium]
MSRRSFLVRSGTVVAAAGTGGLLVAGPAAAANITACDGVIRDEGGEVFDITMSDYGAAGDGTTDDTSAIPAAVSDAAAVGGVVFAPAGVYRITSQIEFSGSVSLVGVGAKAKGDIATQDPGSGNTVFLCDAASAGILVTSNGTFRDFECDGNNTATVPLQHGKLVSGVAQATSGATFVCVWVKNSAGNGFTVYGAQNSAYHDCRARINAGDGLYVDGGAGGLTFWHWEESDNAHYGVHGDAQVSGGTGTYQTHTEDIHFFSGICDGGSVNGIGKMKLRKAVNWSFPALSLVGSSHMSGPTVDLDQTDGYGLDFSGCWIWGNSNYAGIQVGGTGPSTGTPRAFLVTNDIEWHNSGSSVTVTGAPGINRFVARGWMYENAAPVGPSSGPAIDTMLEGRNGGWVTPNPWAPGWSSQGIKYRVNADGAVEFTGAATASNLTASQLFTLAAGYRPSATVTLPAPHSASGAISYVTITSAGVVSTPNPGLFGQVWMDGLSFPTR